MASNQRWLAFVYLFAAGLMLAACEQPSDLPKKVFFDNCAEVADGRYLTAKAIAGPPAPEIGVDCRFGHAATPFQFTEMTGVRIKEIRELNAILRLDPPEVKAGRFTASVILTDNRINCPVRRVFEFEVHNEDGVPSVY